MNNNKITTLVLDESFKDFYRVDNDSCPICEEKFITPSNIVILGRAAFHLDCYHEATNQGIKLK